MDVVAAEGRTDHYLTRAPVRAPGAPGFARTSGTCGELRGSKRIRDGQRGLRAGHVRGVPPRPRCGRPGVASAVRERGRGGAAGDGRRGRGQRGRSGPGGTRARETAASAAAPRPARSRRPAPQRPAPSAAGASPIKGPAANLVANMTESLAVPTATTFRVVPVGALEERRQAAQRRAPGGGPGEQDLLHPSHRLRAGSGHQAPSGHGPHPGARGRRGLPGTARGTRPGPRGRRAA